MTTNPRVVSFIREQLLKQQHSSVDEAALAAALVNHMPGHYSMSPAWHVWQALMELELTGLVGMRPGKGWQLAQGYPMTFPVPVYPTRHGNQEPLFGDNAA